MDGVGEYETGTVCIFTVNPDFASEMFYNQLADREPQATALRIFVQLLKAVEYLALLFGSNSAAGIGYGKYCHVSLHFQRKCDASFGCELCGVDE